MVFIVNFHAFLSISPKDGACARLSEAIRARAQRKAITCERWPIPPARNPVPFAMRLFAFIPGRVVYIEGRRRLLHLGYV